MGKGNKAREWLTYRLGEAAGVNCFLERKPTSQRRRRSMAVNYTTVIQRHGEWWIGWVEEVPGVTSQGQTREELLHNLRDALQEALEMNHAEARAAASGSFEEVSILP
jgi:predicted RNase H-like HicB family nuclease